MSKSEEKKSDDLILNSNNSTHHLSIHKRYGRNKFLSESIFPLFLCFICPFFIRSIVFICTYCHGSISEFFSRIFFDQTITFKYILEKFVYFQWHWPSAFIILLFLFYTIFMTIILPGKEYYGPITDTGHIPVYRDNGFIYYIISLIIFGLLTILLKIKNLSPTYIYNHWEEFLSTINTFAFILCFFNYD